MIDRHALTFPVRTTGPPGVDKPDIGLVFVDLSTQELCITSRVQRQKRPPKTGAEGRRRFGHAFLSAGDLGGITVDKVVHRLCAAQFRHGWQYTKSIAGQKHNVLWMTAAAIRTRVRNLSDRVRSARVFCQRVVIQIKLTRLIVDHNILKDRSKRLGRCVYLRFLFGRQVDHLCVTAPFKIENTPTAPAVLVIANQCA